MWFKRRVVAERRAFLFPCGTRAHARQEEELEYLRDTLEQQNTDKERAIDKGLMKRELEAAKKQAGVARSTVEVTLKLSLFSALP